jgi:hypothetical protein
MTNDVVGQSFPRSVVEDVANQRAGLTEVVVVRAQRVRRPGRDSSSVPEAATPFNVA